MMKEKEKKETGKNHRATGYPVRCPRCVAPESIAPTGRKQQPLAPNPCRILGCPSPIMILPEPGEAVTIQETKKKENKK